MTTKTIKIQYLDDSIPKLTYIGGKSDWIDLAAAKTVTLKAGEFKLIHLGVAMKLPEGYEAHIAPRSSTFKNFEFNPIEKISNFDMARGAFPNNEDVSVVGRGSEDVTLKYNESTKKSEVDIRAGIRTEPSMARENDLIGNIMFNKMFVIMYTIRML